MKILNVVGTRPNFIKIAPLMEQMRRVKTLQPILLHTGQHYDETMNRVFFEQLGIPKPEFNLEVGSGDHAEQVGEVLKRFDSVLRQETPDAVLVVGDVNSTLACALAASYARIPVVHVEAGLRSFDREMPEETNRVLTDQVSDLLFATEKSALRNLEREGIDPAKVHFVGNVMADTLLKHKDLAEQKSEVLKSLQLQRGTYAVLTMHRPSNVDRPAALKSVLQAVRELSRSLPVVFPIHPRTERRIREACLEPLTEGLTQLPPLPYLDMVQLMTHARMVLTDSGGIQEETTILEVPCLTLRENTERPVTVEEGTSTLVGSETERILKEARGILETGGKRGRRPELWDGCAAQRIVKVLSGWSPS